MKATVLWTGGKDSALALYEAVVSGYAVRNLVTFIPEGADFLAHPMAFMKLQSQAMGFSHQTFTITEPFREGYEKAIWAIKERFGVDTLVTGDISQVDGYPNWIRECSLPSGMRVLTPLWEQDRLGLLKRLLSKGFQVIFSGVHKPWFTEDWLGLELNNRVLERLGALGRETGLDLCGEQGEYHTIVLDGPSFKKRIEIGSYTKGINGSMIFLENLSFSLQDK